jgi:hypothetical protein
MVNPAVMQQLAGEHRREDLERVRTGGAGLQLAHPSVRERLGWSLVGLGARLAREPMASGTGYGSHAPGGQRARARSVLPLARM